MQHRLSKSLVALSVATGLALTACGSDAKTTTTTPGTTGGTTAGTTGGTTAMTSGVSLKTICPDEIKVQTD